MVLTLPIGLLLWIIDMTLARSPILQQEEFRSLISAMTIHKNLAKMRQVCQGAVGCQKMTHG